MTPLQPREYDMSDDTRIKIWFRFVPREGWLPHDSEGLWATRLGADTARVDNVPFLVEGVAKDDIVRFRMDDNGLCWVTERVEWSGNCTVRVLPVPTGPLGSSAKAVHEHFAPFGLGGEAYSVQLPLVALNVPANADLAGIKALLVQGEDKGWWHYETPCVGDAWMAA